MDFSLPSEPYSFFDAIAVKEFIQTVENMQKEKLNDVIEMLNSIVEEFYTSICKTVTYFKALYYENDPKINIIHQLASNYVHGLFHSKLWNLLTKVCFTIQDALIHSTCTSSTITNDTPHLVSASERIICKIEEECMTPDEVTNEISEIFQLISTEEQDDAKKDELFKNVLVQVEPKHFMSMYQYILLIPNNPIAPQLRTAIDDLLLNGPVLQIQTENVICLMDDE
ncbi:CYRIA/CYRIB Rac1 binding domain-containing protein [Entamoeba marina]